MKIVSQCREQARRVYYGAVFEAKKGIPVYISIHHSSKPARRRVL